MDMFKAMLEALGLAFLLLCVAAVIGRLRGDAMPPPPPPREESDEHDQGPGL